MEMVFLNFLLNYLFQNHLAKQMRHQRENYFPINKVHMQLSLPNPFKNHFQDDFEAISTVV